MVVQITGTADQNSRALWSAPMHEDLSPGSDLRRSRWDHLECELMLQSSSAQGDTAAVKDFHSRQRSSGNSPRKARCCRADRWYSSPQQLPVARDGPSALAKGVTTGNPFWGIAHVRAVSGSLSSTPSSLSPQSDHFFSAAAGFQPGARLCPSNVRATGRRTSTLLRGPPGFSTSQLLRTKLSSEPVGAVSSRTRR